MSEILLTIYFILPSISKISEILSFQKDTIKIINELYIFCTKSSKYGMCFTCGMQLDLD